MVSSRSQSPHRVYNPFKPGKYDELVYWLCDANYRYFVKGLSLIKRHQDPIAAELHRESYRALSIVLNVGSPSIQSGKCIVGDRFFSSVSLSRDLLDKRTTYIGTLMRNKRDIPPLLTQEKPKFSSDFVYGPPDKKVTM